MKAAKEQPQSETHKLNFGTVLAQQELAQIWAHFKHSSCTGYAHFWHTQKFVFCTKACRTVHVCSVSKAQSDHILKTMLQFKDKLSKSKTIPHIGMEAQLVSIWNVFYLHLSKKYV